MTKLMDLVSMFTLMEPDMKVLGRMIYNMEKVKKLGMMVQFMKENTLLGKSMDMEYIAGMMDPDMKGSGLKIKLKD